ncbi:hypothetical protein CG747_10350 [Streptomyces sp. CB02959]|nr:hypothetical protein CG747_10350 [Streptomyces sp. CB02959]
MAGRGPAPKDPVRRARRNADVMLQTILPFERAAPPELPDWPGEDGDWPVRTRDWWQVWRASPQAEHFSSTDWDFLLDTALIHARLWSGELSAAAELRLRVAKFGATPEDRARLRMQFAPDESRENYPESNSPQSAKKRYSALKVIHPDARA